MKTAMKMMIVVMVALAAVSCRDRNLEKRVAALESKFAEIDKTKPSPAANATPTTPAPAAEVKPDGPLPVIEFGATDHDFGTVAEGKKVSFTYTVKNTGQAPLLIQNAQPSCGCTVPDWTKEAIPVGGSGFVKAEFDTKGKSGIQNKTITVTANTFPKISILKFKAVVTPKPDGVNGPMK